MEVKVHGREGSLHAERRLRGVPQSRLVAHLDKLEAVFLHGVRQSDDPFTQLLPGRLHLVVADVVAVQLGPVLADVDGQDDGEKELADFQTGLFRLDDRKELCQGPARGDAVEQEKVVSLLGHGVDGDHVVHDPVDQGLGLAGAVEKLNVLKTKVET